MAEERNIDDIINEFSTNNYENNHTKNNSFLKGIKTAKGNKEVKIIDIDHYYNFYGIMSPRVDISFLNADENGKDIWINLNDASGQRNYNNNFFVSATIEDNGSRKVSLTLFDRTFYTIQNLLFSAIKRAGASSSLDDKEENDKNKIINSVNISDSKGGKVATLDFIKQDGKNIKNNLKIRWGYNDYNPTTDETKIITNNNYFENINSPKSEGRWNERGRGEISRVENKEKDIIAAGSYEDILTNSNQSTIRSQEEEFFITDVKSTLTETGMRYEINAVGSDSFVLNSFKFIQMYATIEGRAKDIMAYFMNAFNKENSILKVCWNDERKIMNGNEYVRDYQTGKYVLNNKETSMKILQDAQNEVTSEEKSNEILINTLACIDKNSGNTISNSLAQDDIKYEDIMGITFSDTTTFKNNQVIDLLGTFLDCRNEKNKKMSEDSKINDGSIRNNGFKYVVLFTRGLIDNISSYSSMKKKSGYMDDIPVNIPKNLVLSIYLYGIYSSCIKLGFTFEATSDMYTIYESIKDDYNKILSNSKSEEEKKEAEIKYKNTHDVLKKTEDRLKPDCVKEYQDTISKFEIYFKSFKTDGETLENITNNIFNENFLDYLNGNQLINPNQWSKNGNIAKDIYEFANDTYKFLLVIKQDNWNFFRHFKGETNTVQIFDTMNTYGENVATLSGDYISSIIRYCTMIRCLKRNLYSKINYGNFWNKFISINEENIKLDEKSNEKFCEVLRNIRDFTLMDCINILFFLLKAIELHPDEFLININLAKNIKLLLNNFLNKDKELGFDKTIEHLKNKELNEFINNEIKKFINSEENSKKNKMNIIDKASELLGKEVDIPKTDFDADEKDSIIYMLGVNKLYYYKDEKDEENIDFNEPGEFNKKLGTTFRADKINTKLFHCENLSKIATRLEMVKRVVEDLNKILPDFTDNEGFESNEKLTKFKENIRNFVLNFGNNYNTYKFDPKIYLKKFGLKIEKPTKFSDFITGLTIGFPGFGYSNILNSIKYECPSEEGKLLNSGRSFFIDLSIFSVGNPTCLKMDKNFPSPCCYESGNIYQKKSKNKFESKDINESFVNEYHEIIDKLGVIESILKDINDVANYAKAVYEKKVARGDAIEIIEKNLQYSLNNNFSNEEELKLLDEYNTESVKDSLKFVVELENVLNNGGNSDKIYKIRDEIKKRLEKESDKLKKAREKLDYMKENLFKECMINLELGGEESQSLFGSNGQNQKYYKSISSLFNSYVNQCPPLVEFTIEEGTNNQYATKSDENGSVAFTSVDENGDTNFVETESVESSKKMTWSKIGEIEGEHQERVPIIGFHYLRPCTPPYVRKYCWGSGNATQHCVKSVNIETSSEFGMLNSATITNLNSGLQSGIKEDGTKIITNSNEYYKDGIFADAVVRNDTDNQRLINAMINGVKKGTIEILGDPSLRFQGSIQPCAYPIYLDIKLQKDGSWSDNENGYVNCQLSDYYVITGITHNLSSSGYTTTLSVMSYPSLKKEITQI